MIHSKIEAGRKARCNWVVLLAVPTHSQITLSWQRTMRALASMGKFTNPIVFAVRPVNIAFALDICECVGMTGKPPWRSSFLRVVFSVCVTRKKSLSLALYLIKRRCWNNEIDESSHTESYSRITCLAVWPKSYQIVSNWRGIICIFINHKEMGTMASTCFFILNSDEKFRTNPRLINFHVIAYRKFI